MAATGTFGLNLVCHALTLAMEMTRLRTLDHLLVQQGLNSMKMSHCEWAERSDTRESPQETTANNLLRLLYVRMEKTLIYLHLSTQIRTPHQFSAAVIR